MQNPNICNAYTHNPYTCASCAQSNMIVPQGQIVVPTTLPQPLQVQPSAQVQPNQTVNYNQVTPYINTGSKVFTPHIQTKSGTTIATASAVGTPYSPDEAQLVYEGPVKSVNPQITPVEQIDNQIEKDYAEYFKHKAKENAELRKALNNTIKKKERSPLLTSAIKFVIGTAVVAGVVKYRKNIPFIKKIFR